MANNNNNVEIGPDGLARESPAIAYTEKIIEEEQIQLRKYIDENYSKIRDVERELANLSMEMKLTAGPKKAALEHMRKKIELSTERIRAARIKEEQAKTAWELAVKAVQDEEAIKQKLCEDLNNLVQEGSNSQLARLEELKRRLEAMNPSRSSNYGISVGRLNEPIKLTRVSPSSIRSIGDISSLSDMNQRPAEVSVTQSSHPVLSTSEATAGTICNEGKNGSTPVMGQKQPPSDYGEGRGKKKSILHGKVKGIAVPKGRGPAGSGWTGAGFDVDSRG